jgi:hypothetical protein
LAEKAFALMLEIARIDPGHNGSTNNNGPPNDVRVHQNKPSRASLVLARLVPAIPIICLKIDADAGS